MVRFINKNLESASFSSDSLSAVIKLLVSKVATLLPSFFLPFHVCVLCVCVCVCVERGAVNSEVFMNP